MALLLGDENDTPSDQQTNIKASHSYIKRQKTEEGKQNSSPPEKEMIKASTTNHTTTVPNDVRVD